MGKVLSVMSVKGGTGKTTTAVNLAMALNKEGFMVLLIDANLEGSNVAFHLGLSTYDLVTIHDVIRGKAKPKNAIYTHPSGLNLMLGGVYLSDVELRDKGVESIITHLRDDFDFIVIDCSSGLTGSVRSAVKSSDEVIIVTNPELPAVVDAFKAIQFCDNNNVLVRGVIVNKAGKFSDLSISDVESLLGKQVIGVIPLDNVFRKSMSKRSPVVDLKPSSKPANQFMRIASLISGVTFKPTGFWSRLLGF